MGMAKYMKKDILTCGQFLKGKKRTQPDLGETIKAHKGQFLGLGMEDINSYKDIIVIAVFN